jgi:hypothetical protein
MRFNTPPTAEGIRPGDVPEYGVMGYFGLGTFLNYVARRPNVADPINLLPWQDEAIFDTFRFHFAEDEKTAAAILSRHRIRYVVTIPFYLFLKNGASILGLDPGRWLADHRRYEEDLSPARFDFRPAYFSLVTSRLLLLDGSETKIRGRIMPALGRFRLVHQCARKLNERNFGEWVSALPDDLRYCVIHEFVPGARIAGHAMPLSRVRLAVDIRVDATRRFTYRSSTLADAGGRYVFTVPYSDDPAQDVRAEGPYRITTVTGNPHAVLVPEEAVRRGMEVAVSRR